MLSRREFIRVAGLSGLAAFGGASVGSGRALAARSRASNHGGYPDAVTHKIADEVIQFGVWLGGAKGFWGEVGVPSELSGGRTQADAVKVAEAMSVFYQKCDKYAMHVTTQQVSERYYKIPAGGTFDAIHLSPGDKTHRVVDRSGPQARRVVEKYLSFRNAEGVVQRRGYNFSGGQNWRSVKEVASGLPAWNNKSNGVYGEDYWYPGTVEANASPLGFANSFEYLASRGTRLVRLGYRMERLDPTLLDTNGPLDAFELGKLKEAVDLAGAAGLKVVLDCHNYGAYHHTSGKQQLGATGNYSAADLRNHWVKMTKALAGNDAVVALGVLNEPNNDGGIKPNTAKYPNSEAGEARTWEDIANHVVSGIRNTGAPGSTKPVAVATYRGVKYHTAPFVVGKGWVWYEQHTYPFGPANEYTYEEANARAAANGF